MSHHEPESKPNDSQEITTPKDFFSRLLKPDAITVHRMRDRLGMLRNTYEKDSYFHDAAFWAIYGIGGVVTKGPDRPDIDLLVASNARFDHSFEPQRQRDYERIRSISDGDWLVGTLVEMLEAEYDVRVQDPIPDEYDLSSNPKALLRFDPKGTGIKPIDLVYVNTRFVDPSIKSFEEFETFDVDENGKPIPRILLAAFKALGVSVPLRP